MSLFGPTWESISAWALRRECGLLSRSESAHSIVADDVSVPADSIPCLSF